MKPILLLFSCFTFYLNTLFAQVWQDTTFMKNDTTIKLEIYLVNNRLANSEGGISKKVTKHIGKKFYSRAYYDIDGFP